LELGPVLALGLGVAFILLELCFELEGLEDLESRKGLVENKTGHGGRGQTIMYVRLRIRDRKSVKPQRYMFRCE